jgi:hypothetical protein
MTPMTRIHVGGDPCSAPVKGTGKESSMGDLGEAVTGAPIRFGSFSLGNVFQREIKKLGRFAFQEKHSMGDAVAKFVDEFIRLQHETNENLKQAGESGGLQFEKEENSGGGGARCKCLL